MLFSWMAEGNKNHVNFINPKNASTLQPQKEKAKDNCLNDILISRTHGIYVYYFHISYALLLQHNHETARREVTESCHTDLDFFSLTILTNVSLWEFQTNLKVCTIMRQEEQRGTCMQNMLNTQSNPSLNWKMLGTKSSVQICYRMIILKILNPLSYD
ncbi:CLUMA_CG016824, isoform A [Clunio marinus]|uniref:CLUMA_CG016824, isoform A n=1 Tax=Clunio marinus TaxID=568069 RepID=A0A1J1ITS1_9DIPT|nr:CLUMA_CG016824, isoform A [Clunio marinus]